MNVAILWDTAPSSPYVNRRFGGMYHLHVQCRKSAEQENSVQPPGMVWRLLLREEEKNNLKLILNLT
jgi:hypothetical protein